MAVRRSIPSKRRKSNFDANQKLAGNVRHVTLFSGRYRFLLESKSVDVRQRNWANVIFIRGTWPIEGFVSWVTATTQHSCCSLLLDVCWGRDTFDRDLYFSLPKSSICKSRPIDMTLFCILFFGICKRMYASAPLYLHSYLHLYILTHKRQYLHTCTHTSRHMYYV